MTQAARAFAPQNRGTMVKFAIRAHVEQLGPRRFLTRAVAIPCDCEERSAPEERTVLSPSLAKAQAAGERLARQLAEDIAARGNHVVQDVQGA